MNVLRRARALSIRTKLIVLIVLFLCLPFFVFGMLWYAKATETIEVNAIDSSSQLISQLNEQLDAYFADLERVTFPVITHPLIQKFMKIPKEEAFERFVVTRDIEKELLPNFIFGRPDIYGFSVVSPGGIASYGGVSSKEDNLKLFEQFRDAGRFRIVGMRRLDYPVVTVVRTFRDVATYQTIGMLVIDLNVNQISNILAKIQLGQTGYVWILDNNSQILFHPDSEKRGRKVDPDIARQFEASREGHFFKTDANGGKTLVIYHRSEVTNWTMVAEVPLRELIGTLISLRNVTLWIGFFLILFVLIVLAAFSHNLTRSLLHLQRLMRKAENGDLSVKAPERREDEIGILYRSFNKMVTEIRRLIEVVHASKLKEKELQLKQREAMMQAMQSQINPHFLYNTLEVINSYAVVEGVMPISNMATALADIFRYSVGSSRQIVTLKEELDHVKTYLEIQKERYPYLKFDCRADMATAAQVSAVRLILQPLIENGIIHGYEKHKLRPEYVGIAEERGDRHCIIRVIDKGKGMEPERKAMYNRMFAGSLSQDETELPYRRIGLLNVHYRIRLTYGEPYGLFIEKSDADGTVIQIKLPYIEQEGRTTG